MIPKRPAPDLIRGGNRFSAKIMIKLKSSNHGQGLLSFISRVLSTPLIEKLL
jgi:hypothetical protein